MDKSFDFQAFFDELQATKPPYKCPFKSCDKIYRSFGGIQYHILHSHNHNGWKPAGKLSKWNKNRIKNKISETGNRSDNDEDLEVLEGVFKVLINSQKASFHEDTKVFFSHF